MNAKPEWTGNTKSAFTCIGASNHSDTERVTRDYYATDPKALEVFLDESDIDLAPDIWECAVGEGHLSKLLEERGYNVWKTDIVDRGCNDATFDFLTWNGNKWDGDILTNPPYSMAQEFVEKALDVVENGRQVIMFLKLTFLESQKRRGLFNKFPPKTVYVSRSRLHCARNGDFEAHAKSNAIAYAWYVWEKGYTGVPIIQWIN